MQSSWIIVCFFYANAYAGNGDDVTSSDYAEVRALLDQFYQITARKYGSFHDYDPKKVSKMLKNIPTEDGTEAGVNRKEGIVGDLFENDILLTLPQAKALLKETSKSRDARQAIRGSQHNWIKMPISYRFGYFDVKWQKLIRSALRHIETETCIRFRENGNDRDHLLYARASGCWSSVGRIGGRQLVSIGFGCDGMGIVVHETLHALGLWHEQSRSDRDNYIWINYINIYPGTQGNFERRTTLNSDNMGQPYDLGSVMHYGSRAFTTNFDRYTIETRDRHYQHTIGQRHGLSFKDAKMINLHYCKDVCKHQLYCYNGGYTDPNNCTQCKCPTGFGGKDCTAVQKSDFCYQFNENLETANCGGDLIAGYDYESINSSGLGANAHCIWRIRSSVRVVVYIDELVLPCRDACTSYLELKYKSDMVATGPRLCCGPSSLPISSEGSTFIIMYFANAATDDYRSRGFKLRYKLYDPSAPATSRPSTSRPILTTAPSKSSVRTNTWRTTTSSAEWSGWGYWSACSVSCGGCGTRRRIRACYGANRRCVGPDEDVEECGERRCPIGTGFSCRGRLIMPCNLLDNLHFASDKSIQLSSRDKSLFADAIKYKKRYSGDIKAYQSEQLCQKYFNYQCSLSLLTLYLNWKTTSWPDVDERGCCEGFHYNGTACIRI